MAHKNLARKLKKHQSTRKRIYRRKKSQFKELVKNPPEVDAILLTCADSRVDPSLIFGDEFDTFIDRSVGNVFTDNAQLTTAMAVVLKKVRLILVMGHSDCVAMKCVLDDDLASQVPGMRSWLCQYCGEAYKCAFESSESNESEADRLKSVIQANIIEQVQRARYGIALISSANNVGDPNLVDETLVVGLYYDLESGKLFAFDEWFSKKPKWRSAARVLKHLPAYD